MKKRLNKRRKNGKSKLNISQIILILGLIFFVPCFIYTSILRFPTTAITYYANLIGLLLLYLGGCLYFILLGKPFYKSWKYIKESKNYLLFVILVFLLGAIAALFYQPQIFIDLIRQFVEELLKETSDLNVWQMIIYILNNNLKASFLAMLAGVVLGIFPFFTALVNGYILGFVAEKSVGTDGILVLWKLVPHGIFELPAVFLSLALGVRLGMFFIEERRREERALLNRLYESLRVFLFIILPLLIIAALIEGSLMFVLG